MIIASNFKTNHTRKSTKEFVKRVNDFAKDTNVEVRIYPPFSALDCFDVSKNIKVGTQNFYPVQNGSYTGEIGFEQLEEFEIETVLIGHSERRHILNESNEFIKNKFDEAKKKNLEIVFCIGEPKEVREAGLSAVMDYLWKQCDGIDLDYENLVVAYEPVWAIGTGLSASINDIDETLTSLRKKIKKPLLYGGSVKVENVADILSIENCDGILVGTASWKVESFCKMIEAAK
jgi:triosephosphate isomerase